MNKVTVGILVIIGLAMLAINSFGTSELRKFNSLEKKAKDGDAKSQFELAMHLGRNTVNGTHEKAMADEWLRLSVNQEYKEAQLCLGFMLYHGAGVTQNEPRAVEMYKRAARQESIEAKYMLGEAYSAGRGVKQSHEEAAKWFSDAARQGIRQSVGTRDI